MSYFVYFVAAMFFTGLAYYLADRTLYHRLAWWQPFLIGVVVVSAGALTEALGAPILLIMLVPIPLGMLLLLYWMGWVWKQWLATYLLTWVYYTVLHVVLSYLFAFNSLIPAWPLRGT